MMAKENPDVNGDGHAYVKLMSAPSPTKYDPPLSLQTTNSC